jgi:hypothetical protein
MGWLTVAFSPLEKTRSWKYRVLAPWVVGRSYHERYSKQYSSGDQNKMRG